MRKIDGTTYVVLLVLYFLVMILILQTYNTTRITTLGQWAIRLPLMAIGWLIFYRILGWELLKCSYLQGIKMGAIIGLTVLSFVGAFFLTLLMLSAVFSVLF